MHNNNEITQRCPPQRHASPKSKYEKQYLVHLVIEGELAVNFHAKDIEVGSSVNSNPRQDQVILSRDPIGILVKMVLDPITTEAFVLLEFSVMHQ